MIIYILCFSVEKLFKKGVRQVYFFFLKELGAITSDSVLTYTKKLHTSKRREIFLSQFNVYNLIKTVKIEGETTGEVHTCPLVVGKVAVRASL